MEDSSTVDPWGLIARRLDALDQDQQEIAARLRKIEQRLARLTPGTGEVSLAAPWSRPQIAVAVALVAVLGFFGQDMWREQRRQGAEIRRLTEFASQGARATSADLVMMVDLQAQTRRCVRLRFQERRRGLREGTGLPPPESSLLDQIEECLEDLDSAALEELRAELLGR